RRVVRSHDSSWLQSCWLAPPSAARPLAPLRGGSVRAARAGCLAPLVCSWDSRARRVSAAPAQVGRGGGLRSHDSSWLQSCWLAPPSAARPLAPLRGGSVRAARAGCLAPPLFCSWDSRARRVWAAPAMSGARTGYAATIHRGCSRRRRRCAAYDEEATVPGPELPRGERLSALFTVRAA